MYIDIFFFFVFQVEPLPLSHFSNLPHLSCLSHPTLAPVYRSLSDHTMPWWRADIGGMGAIVNHSLSSSICHPLLPIDFFHLRDGGHGLVIWVCCIAICWCQLISFIHRQWQWVSHMKIEILILGYVCFGCKWNWENILHPWECLGTHENSVKLKIYLSWL